MAEPVDSFALTPEQQDTAALLERLFGKVIADRYVDFSLLAAGATELHVSRPVAAHVLRELESMLRQALEVPMDAKAIPAERDQENFDKAAAALRAVPLEEATVQRALKALKPRLNHADQIRMIAQRLGFAPDGDIASAWVTLCRIFGRAHERSFHRTLEVDDEFRAQFQQPFDLVIRSVAIALQGRYSALMRRVTELATMHDAAHAIKQFEREIPGAMPLQWHFFQTIDSPRWLMPLLDSNLIGEPFAETGESGRGTGFRQWPVGNYLLRMAKSEDTSARRLVTDALWRIASSKHPDVRQQGLEIIAALPGDEATAVIDIAVGWLDLDLRDMVLETPMRLVKSFATSGQTTASFRMAHAIFQLFDDDGSLATLHAQHMYEHYLRQGVAELTKLDGIAAVRFFSELLVRAATIKRKFGGEPTADFTDHTPRPIAESQMANYGVYDGLIIAVRDAAATAIQTAPGQTLGIVSYLLEYHLRIFKRIALHVLSKEPASAPDLAAALLQNPAFIGESWCEDEYAELALAWFRSIKQTDQEHIFATIDAIPDQRRAGWRQRFEEYHRTPPTAENEREFDASIIRDATWKWRDALPAARREVLDNIVSEYGDPDAWRGQLFPPETSPLTEEDFASRPVSEMVAFLESWQPEQEPVKQTIAALGQQLRAAIEQEPARFAESAGQFNRLRSVYVRRVLEGFESAARKQQKFEWHSILSLIEATIDRLAASVNGSLLVEGDDPNWQWAASTAANLLKAGLRQGETGPSYDCAARIRAAIAKLLRLAPRSAETPNFEEDFQRFPYFAAEQTLRGSAVELCVLFFYWAGKRADSPIATAPRTALQHFADIRSLLEAELDDTSASGRIPRAILGRYLRRLFYFGEDWLKPHMSALFPSDDNELRRAAWSGHLLNDAGPAGELMSQLEQSYADEISRLGQDDVDDDQDMRENRLGEYLVLLFITQQLPYGIIEAFWRTDAPRARQHAMTFLGRQLQLPPARLPDDMRARAMGYWDARLSAAESTSDKDTFRLELGAIGRWFGQEGIESNWLIEQLLRLLKAGFSPNSGYSVIEWLGKVASSRPEQAIEVLSSMLKTPYREPWTYLNRVSIRTILIESLEHGTTESVRRAQETISYLASLGETSYLDLLNSTEALGEQGLCLASAPRLQD